MTGTHTHRPESEHIEPSTHRATRGQSRRPAFTRVGRCLHCGRRIIYVEPDAARQGYWRAAA